MLEIIYILLVTIVIAVGLSSYCFEKGYTDLADVFMYMVYTMVVLGIIISLYGLYGGRI